MGNCKSLEEVDLSKHEIQPRDPHLTSLGEIV